MERGPSASTIPSFIARLFNKTVPESGSRGRVTVDQLKDMIARREDFMLIDIRYWWEYHSEHIPGSISMPPNKLYALPTLDSLRQKKVVVYCKAGVRSVKVKNRLMDLGIADVVDLEGGIDEWVEMNGVTRSAESSDVSRTVA